MAKIIERPDLPTAFENMVRVWQKQNMRCETDINELIGRMRTLVERAEWKTINRWIPCSERLPEDGVNVNITWVNKTISDDKFLGTAQRLDGVWYWYPLSSRFLVEIDEECGIEVLAWMPMPDSYEPPEKE